MISLYNTDPDERLVEFQDPIRKTEPARGQAPALSASPNRRVFNSVFEMLPSVENPSPLVRINRLNPTERFALYAKLEWLNPFGSVKDRAAWAMLQDLELRGEVGCGRGMVEPTAAALARVALDEARLQGWRIVPRCSYVTTFIERNTEFAGLLDAPRPPAL